MIKEGIDHLDEQTKTNYERLYAMQTTKYLSCFTVFGRL